MILSTNNQNYQKRGYKISNIRKEFIKHKEIPMQIMEGNLFNPLFTACSLTTTECLLLTQQLFYAHFNISLYF
jgi:hypothetical protein